MAEETNAVDCRECEKDTNAAYAFEERRHFDSVLAFALGVGTGLLSCGASVSRVEIAVERICLSCGAKEVNVFALPSMVLCSIKVADGSEVSQMKRNFEVSNNFFKMEKYNQLSRDLCDHKLSLEEAEKQLDVINSGSWHKVPLIVLGGGVLAGAFSVFFGGALIDALPSLLIGCLMSYLNILLSRRDFNAYARTFMLSLVGGFLSILLSRALIACGICCSVSMVTIGTIMVVVPGLLICNAVRDLFSGDIYSGAFELLNGVLSILAIAAGYGAALFILRDVVVYVAIVPRTGVLYYVYAMASCVVGACGVAVMFNSAAKKILISLGNIVAAFAIYLIMETYVGEDFIDNFVSTVFAACAAEILARIFKAPSTIFLVPAIIVLVPGGALYYAMNGIVMGDMADAVSFGKSGGLTLLGISVGISVVTALFQIIHPLKGKAAIKRLFRHQKISSDKQ